MKPHVAWLKNHHHLLGMISQDIFVAWNLREASPPPPHHPSWLPTDNWNYDRSFPAVASFSWPVTSAKRWFHAVMHLQSNGNCFWTLGSVGPRQSFDGFCCLFSFPQFFSAAWWNVAFINSQKSHSIQHLHGRKNVKQDTYQLRIPEISSFGFNQTIFPPKNKPFVLHPSYQRIPPAGSAEKNPHGNIKYQTGKLVDWCGSIPVALFDPNRCGRYTP